MLPYIGKRLLLMIPTLLGITIVTFSIAHLTPGNPVTAGRGGVLSAKMSAQAIEEVRHLYGLDKPLAVQYWDWLKRSLKLDFGNSFKDGRKVIIKIAERLPATLILNLVSFFLIYLISLPLGVLAAIKQNSLIDRSITALLFMLYSLPSFWVALLLMIQLGVKWDLLPLYGMESDYAFTLPFWQRMGDHALHLVMPVICLTYGGLAFLSRLARTGMLEVIRQDYIRTARAKGLSEKMVIFKHAFRNSLIPIVTLFAALLPALISGTVIIESIFSWPGIGRLFYESILARDYPTVMGLSTITAVLTLIGILLADLLYVLVDPRISFEAVR